MSASWQIPLERERLSAGMDLTEGLLDVPGGDYLASRTAGDDQPGELAARVFAETSWASTSKLPAR